MEALSAPLSVTAQATPTPLWAVDWGPTHPLEDETHHFLSSQETVHQVAATTSAETWPHHQSAPGSTAPQESLLEARDAEGEEDGEREAEEREPEEGGHRLKSSLYREDEGCSGAETFVNKYIEYSGEISIIGEMTAPHWASYCVCV